MLIYVAHPYGGNLQYTLLLLIQNAELYVSDPFILFTIHFATINTLRLFGTFAQLVYLQYTLLLLIPRCIATKYNG